MATRKTYNTKKDIEELISTHIDKYDKKVDKKFDTNFKELPKNKDFEKSVKDIAAEVIVSLYRNFWIRKDVWRNAIKK